MNTLFISDIAAFNKRQINVKSYIRNGRVVKQSQRDINQSDNNKKKKNDVLKKALIAGALTVGVPVATYAVFRAKYRANFIKTAKDVDNRANEMQSIVNNIFSGKKVTIPQDHPQYDNLTDLQKFVQKGYVDPVTRTKYPGYDSNKPSILFTVGGLDGKGIESKAMITGRPAYGTYKGQSSTLRDILPDHNAIPFKNDKLQPSPLNIEDYKPGLQGFVTPYRKAISAILGNALVKGRNEDAVNLAAITTAVSKAQPGKNIHMLGYSGGGIAVAEANEYLNILKKQGKFNSEVKGMAIGTPYFGLTDLPKNQFRTVISDKDYDLKAFTSQQNPLRIKDTVGHSLYSNTMAGETGYMNSNQFKLASQQFFSGTKFKNSIKDKK